MSLFNCGSAGGASFTPIRDQVTGMEVTTGPAVNGQPYRIRVGWAPINCRCAHCCAYLGWRYSRTCNATLLRQRAAVQASCYLPA